MKLLSLYIVWFCVVVVVSGAQRQSYLLPEPRSVEYEVQSNAIPYEYQLVPNGDYSVSSYEPEEFSILDVVLSPVTAMFSIVATALSTVNWLVVKGGLVLLGMAMVIGFCGCTTYCTLTIENPFGRALPSIPYLDDIQYYFTEAYNKYHEMQS